MKKNIFFLPIFFLFAFMQDVSAQCNIPESYNGNTGSNMTVFFTSDAVSALPLTSNSPYVVAISTSGLIVGSQSFASEDLIGGQAQMAVFGDDSTNVLKQHHDGSNADLA